MDEFDYWSHRDALPYFERPERAQRIGDAGAHGPNPASAAFLEARAELDFPRPRAESAGTGSGRVPR